VESLLRDGWQVHVPWRRESEAQALAQRLGHPQTLVTAGADLSDPDGVARYFGQVAASTPSLDLLCNLVGGFAAAPLDETDPATWDRMMAMNATPTFLVTRSALPLLRASGRASIVNVAAAAALGGPKAGMSAYVASKAAVVSLTTNLAEEFGPEGITVNAVAPTLIDTAANRSAMPDASRDAWLSPEEIAAVVRFLAGPDARIISGNVIGLRKG
jgi:NAD(P)-dependent dehydrogenase (short-subunit alcohol dehydrogenase family)